jgi:thiamine-phosphate pyrophosphorylase
VHGEEEAREALGVDFLLAGSTFVTASHPGRPPIGLEGVLKIVRVADGVPVLAIGGIDAERVEEVMATGAYGVALLSGVWDAEDPRAAVLSLLDRIDRSLQTSESRSGGR